MTRYTNGHGRSIIICDQCRKDLELGDNVYAFTLNKVADGYTTRDFDKGETVLCLDCANITNQVLTILGTRYADSLIIHQTL